MLVPAQAVGDAVGQDEILSMEQRLGAGQPEKRPDTGHNKLKMVQHNKLIIVKRNKLKDARREKLTQGQR